MPKFSNIHKKSFNIKSAKEKFRVIRSKQEKADRAVASRDTLVDRGKEREGLVGWQAEGSGSDQVETISLEESRKG